MTKHLPLIGFVVSVCLFVGAAAGYLGGTTFSADSVGYNWGRNFSSTLFAPTALNGAANPGRAFAVAAMLVLCLSLGLVFKSIAANTESRAHKKVIEIAGFGSMVYALLVVTPMHDLIVGISLLFMLAAMGAMLHGLYIERSMRLFAAGKFCVLLLLASGGMYYGNVLYGLLPIAQKLTFASSAAWLLSLYYHTLQSASSLRPRS